MKTVFKTLKNCESCKDLIYCKRDNEAKIFLKVCGKNFGGTCKYLFDKISSILDRD